MILNFPTRQNSLPAAPPPHVHKVVEVFHYLLPPDEHGDALVIMAPNWCMKDRYPSDIANMIEAGSLMVHNKGSYLGTSPQAYLHGTMELGGRVVFLYVMFTAVVPPGEWRN